MTRSRNYNQDYNYFNDINDDDGDAQNNDNKMMTMVMMIIKSE